MQTSRVIRFFLVLSFAFVILAIAAPVDAQEKNVVVPRRDIDITIQASGDVRFNETWQVQFIGGPFTNAFSGIGLDKVDAVTDFQISEGGRAYQQNSSEAANTFKVYPDQGLQVVKWYFSSTTNQTRTFNVQFTLRGVLTLYPDGDQFWWYVIRSDRQYTIQNSTVTIHLPASFPTDQIKAVITTGRGDVSVRDGQTIVFTSSNLTPGSALEIRVQFPHGVVTTAPPAWQAAADAAAAEQTQKERLEPAFELFILILKWLLLSQGIPLPI